MFDNIRIVRKIEPWLPTFGIWVENVGRKTNWIWAETFFFVWSLPKFGKKNGLNLNEDLFLWSSCFWSISFPFGFYLPFHISGYAPALPPFENPAYATGTGVGNLFRLGRIRPAISKINLRSIPNVTSGSLWLHNQILLWNYPTIWRHLLFFSGFSIINRWKPILKFSEGLF